MSKITQRVFHINAFATQSFAGNPASVFPLEHWLDDSLMQMMAAETGMTCAFFVGQEGHYEIRWFTPATEIKGLCGHGTLAAAFVIAYELEDSSQELTFHVDTGELKVRRQPGGGFTMDLPALNPRTIAAPANIKDVLGCQPEEVLGDLDMMFILSCEKAVREFVPKLERLLQLPLRAVIITAPGDSVDFVSRWFGPKHGDGEDIGFTGSAHCSLVPYWSSRLGKTELRATQLSPRGATLDCQLHKDRVLVSCFATKYMEGHVYL
ncbi:MAG: PhzF family phenazine biosynthesis protein [Pseudomonadota bacterium]